MNPTRRRARCAVLLLVGLLALASFHCSSGGAGTLGDAGLADGSTHLDGGGDAAACPASPPANGTACALPDGTDCTAHYPQPGCYCCSGSTYTCRGGKWSVAGGGGPPDSVVSCPATVPDDNASCGSPCSGGAQTQCSYDCDTGKGAHRTATCVNGLWRVTSLAIACSTDAGAADAADAADGG